MLDHCRTAFNPVAAIDVAKAILGADDGMVDVTADDAVCAAPACLSGESLLERPDEIDGVLHFQLGPLGK
jgi:hypothetical protein